MRDSVTFRVGPANIWCGNPRRTIASSSVVNCNRLCIVALTLARKAQHISLAGLHIRGPAEVGPKSTSAIAEDVHATILILGSVEEGRKAG